MRIMIKLVALAMVCVFSAIVAGQAQTGASAAEQQLFAGVNRARKAQGLPGLKWNDALAAARAPTCSINGAT